jgi:CheY-like chemotaxis protein
MNQRDRHIRSVLVVDDTEIIRDLLVDVLRNDGYTVEKAANGIEAVEMVKNQRYDLVFTDMHMPRQDGLTTARKVHEISPATLVIVTDSYPDKLSHAILNEAVVGTICKPFDLAELRAVLQRVEEVAIKKSASEQGAVKSQTKALGY